MNIDEMLFKILDLGSLKNISNGIRDKIINDSELKGLDKEIIIKNSTEVLEEMGLPSNIKKSLIDRAKKDLGEEEAKKSEDIPEFPSAHLKDIVNNIVENLKLVNPRLKGLTTAVNFLDNKINERINLIDKRFSDIEKRIDFLFKKLNLEH